MPPPFEASLGAMGMALEGGEVNAGNEVHYSPVGLYSTSAAPNFRRVVAAIVPADGGRGAIQHSLEHSSAAWRAHGLRAKHLLRVLIPARIVDVQANVLSLSSRLIAREK